MPRELLESEIESDFCRNLRHGIALKIRERHWPDRVVLLEGGKTLFVEFKRPGESLRPGQSIMQDYLQRLGYPYLIATSADQALSWVESHAV